MPTPSSAPSPRPISTSVSPTASPVPPPYSEFIATARKELADELWLNPAFQQLRQHYQRFDTLQNQPVGKAAVHLAALSVQQQLLDSQDTSWGKTFSHFLPSLQAFLGAGQVAVPKQWHVTCLEPLTSGQEQALQALAQANPDYQVTLWLDPRAVIAGELYQAIIAKASADLGSARMTTEFSKNVTDNILQLQNQLLVSGALAVDSNKSVRGFTAEYLGQQADGFLKSVKKTSTSDEDICQGITP